MHNPTVILNLKNIDKRFGGVHALEQVNLKINKGEVHAIVGENGAGKSTLMKILSGTYQPDSGEIFMKGEKTSFRNPLESHEAGINIIYQEFFSFPTLDVTANVFAGKEILKFGILNNNEMRKKTCGVFDRIGVEINVDEIVENLSVANKQVIEIAKALVFEGNIVIMDEPNSALNDKETQALFQIIRKLKEQDITILYVSHRLEEVFKISDRITVLRDGKYMGTWETKKTSIPFIISQMIGRTFDETFPPIKKIDKKAQLILEIRNLSKEKCLENVSFSVRAGEILGFAGLEGSGIRDLFHILFGLEKANSGEILFEGKKTNIHSTSQAIKAGWGLIPANRREHGLIMAWPLDENIALVILRRLLNFFRLINNQKKQTKALEYIKKLRISTDSIEKIVFDLSGGNQQKAVIAKWLATEPKMLILDDPTRGIDVGAKVEVYGFMQELTKQGITILFTSSEFDEVLGLSHRIIVMRQGKIIQEFNHKEASKAEILRYVSGDIDNNK